MPSNFTTLFLLLLFSSCNSSPTTEKVGQSPETTNETILVAPSSTIVTTENSIDSLSEIDSDLIEAEYNREDPVNSAAYHPKDAHFPTFDRSIIEAQLKQKVAHKKPLIVHIFVPLCDNEHQGIVPTTPSLGNGFSLRSNLYWATSNGMKRYFKEKKHWTLLKNMKDVYQDSVVLERVVFKRTYPNEAVVYLIADAYRGDKMLATVNHFLRAASNNYTEQLKINDSTSISIHGAADLVVFNGHNGLFDLYYNQPDRWYNSTNSQKDVAIIACYASDYFEREAMRAKAYPILRAKGRLHPGAFVISGVIDKWAMLQSVEEMRLSAGKAYCKIHDCSIKTSKKLFYKGWQPKNLSPDF